MRAAGDRAPRVAPVEAEVRERRRRLVGQAHERDWPTLDEVREALAPATAATVREVLAGEVGYYGPGSIARPSPIQPGHRVHPGGFGPRMHAPSCGVPGCVIDHDAAWSRTMADDAYLD